MAVHSTNTTQLFYNHYAGQLVRYGDGADNTIEENSSIFSLIRMC